MNFSIYGGFIPSFGESDDAFILTKQISRRAICRHAACGQDKIHSKESVIEMTAAVSPAVHKTAGNENTKLLKIIAYIFMFADHVGVALLPQYTVLRLIGRLSFPLFAWCLVVGSEYTHNIWKYALRLLIGMVVSQPCYVLALNEPWDSLNIFATLLLGLLAIAGIRMNKKGSAWLFPLLAILFTLVVHVDYGWQGVALILLLYAARKNRGALAAAFVAFCLHWGANTFSVAKMLGIPSAISFLPQARTLLNAVSKVQFYAVLALPLILIPMDKWQVRIPRWIEYAIYPAHLLIIWVIRCFLTGA